MTRAKPLEVKRAEGNKSKRKLPAPTSTAGLRLTKPPTAPETLGKAGLAAWERVWTYGADWLAPVDYDVVATYCHGIDEVEVIRAGLADNPGDFHLRAALRALNAELLRAAGVLYLTPTDRGRSGGPGDARATAARAEAARALGALPPSLTKGRR